MKKNEKKENKKDLKILIILTVIIVSIIVIFAIASILKNKAVNNKKSVEEIEANNVLNGIIDYCKKEKLEDIKTTYCQDEKLLKQNVEKIVNLDEVNKDSLIIELDDKGNISKLKFNLNGKDFKLNNGEMKLAEPTPDPISFEKDSWETIQKAVKEGNTSKYKVGDIKTVVLSELITSPTEDTLVGGTYKVRIANMSTPDECKQKGFSQSACGFVVEFINVITKYNMNPTTTEFEYGTNKGGWPASDMYKLLNNETNSIYSVLPEDLKTAIIDTYVVSGHGSIEGESNFTSTDKLYLLSTREVWGKEEIDEKKIFDTADNDSDTRQLDYYKEKNVTINNFSSASKSYNKSKTPWWLRSANKNFDQHFSSVRESGEWRNIRANSSRGVAPAFRIG